jgi:glycosyltransferase involved in cell wall biosynthesis
MFGFCWFWMNGLDRIESSKMNNLTSPLENTRFLFVVNTLSAFGGAERQALILASYIKQHISPHVSFLAFEDGGHFRNLLTEAGFAVHYFPFRHHAPKPQKVFQYLKLIRFLKPLRPDVFIPYVAESNKIVAQIWKYTGAKFAFWNQREEGRKLYGTPREKKLLQAIPAIVSNSFEGRDALVRVYGIKSDQVTVINNGIVPYSEQAECYDWHAHFGIAQDRPLVSMIANITNRKDHETLLKAWSIVVEECKKNKMEIPFLVLAGRKAETYDRLRLLAFDLRLSDHIGFTGTLQSVQGLIQKSLFCVFSSNLEGCPNGVLECMEQGKAVIGTKISGVAQALGTKYGELTFSKPNDSPHLASRILNLYKQPLLMAEIGKYNALRIKTEFSVEKMVQAHLDLISSGILSKA